MPAPNSNTLPVLLPPLLLLLLQVLMVERTKDDEVLVMASDGLWDVIGNQEAADMAVHSLQVSQQLLSRGLIGKERSGARDRWIQGRQLSCVLFYCHAFPVALAGNLIVSCSSGLLC